MNGLSLYGTMKPHLAKHGFIVSASGIRYGSVAYLGFGEGTPKQITPAISAVVYPVEIEIGADEWILSNNDTSIITSRYIGVIEARKIIENTIVGKIIKEIRTSVDGSTILFQGDIVLRSILTPIPASGFLYSFSVVDGPSWETLDGFVPNNA